MMKPRNIAAKCPTGKLPMRGELLGQAQSGDQ
jgi:hypothetical protein